MPTKGDFIIDLLTTNRLAQSDRERILKLSAKEYGKNSEELINLKVQINEIISSKIVDSKTEVIKQNDLNKKRTLDDYIKPSLLSEFLIAYNQNPILKTTCHKIDESELERLKEILEIEEYDFNKHLSKINEEYKKLTNNYKNVNINIRELIRVYLTGEGQGHWTTDKIKITWGSKQLKDWAKKYPGVPANPDDDVISNLENIGFEFDTIRVNSGAKKIQTFSDLVIHFKHMFHLRSDNLLKDLILKKNIQKGWNNSIFFEINHSDFWSNIELFCDVDKLIQSYVKIIDMILEVTKKNKLSKPKVKLKFKEEGDAIIFTIHHQNSKFKRTMQNIKEGRFGTKLTDLIQNQINGLCDFYIQADFDNNQFAQINLWNGEAIEPKPLKSYVGVEFILKFKG